ncbi:transcription factor SOX-9-like [Planococcus citri]|uniref:transcription factor SOX-9-like n=1 Tax=Planococcus citri TaxID=170843 RepID=UPI0031F72ACE
MKAIIAISMLVSLVMAAPAPSVVDSGVAASSASAATSSSAQLVQSNVNLQNSVDSSVVSPVDQQPESVTSQIAVQQEILQVSQDAPVPPSSPPSSPTQSNAQPVPVVPIDPQNVQLLKEANAQYQYQINSRYEEKTRPIYGDVSPQHQQQYSNQPYQSTMYIGLPPSSAVAYPYYKENVQYQELGNGQRRAETVVNDNVRAQYENQDAYNHQRSQSYLEYGKGELSPDYNTYSYKRTYY